MKRTFMNLPSFPRRGHETLLAIGVVMVFMINLMPIRFSQAQDEKKTSEDVILTLKTLKTVQEKIDYLLAEGHHFLDQERYWEAVEISRHIIENLDKDHAEARELLKNAKTRLEEETMPKILPVKAKY